MKTKHPMVDLHNAIEKAINKTMHGMGQPHLNDIKDAESLKELLIYQTAYHHLVVIRKTIETQTTI